MCKEDAFFGCLQQTFVLLGRVLIGAAGNHVNNTLNLFFPVHQQYTKVCSKMNTLYYTFET